VSARIAGLNWRPLRRAGVRGLAGWGQVGGGGGGGGVGGAGGRGGKGLDSFLISFS